MARLEAIRRANDLLYEQTDKMKMLRSQMLYADVIHTRFQQIEEKKKVKEVEKLKEAEYHQEILKQVKRAEEIEKAKIDKVKANVDVIKKTREEQLEEVRKIREKEERKRREAGEAMKREAQERLEEEVREYHKRQQHIAESNAAMVKANEELKRVRQELAEKEREAEAKRDAEVAKIEYRKQALKRLEQERFERAQVTRQKMIDTAVERLAQQSNKEQAILDKQIQDLQERQDRFLAEKAAKAEKDWVDIVDSRTKQMERKKLEAEEQKKIDDYLLAKWKKENEDGMKAEQKKAADARSATIKIKQLQYEDGKEAARRRKENRLIEIEQAKFLQSIDNNDDARFTELCNAEIERNIKLGKPVYTLLRALEYTDPPLLAAKINKINRNG